MAKNKEYSKAYYKANKERLKAKMKEYYESNCDYLKLRAKARNELHKEEIKIYKKIWREANPDYMNNYNKLDTNLFGQTKNSIRGKSNKILKQMNLKFPSYEIHHCFGYEDASKFIYISKSLHLKIHKYLHENNIDASTNHWMAIRDIVNNTNEFTYIKA